MHEKQTGTTKMWASEGIKEIDMLCLIMRTWKKTLLHLQQRVDWSRRAGKIPDKDLTKMNADMEGEHNLEDVVAEVRSNMSFYARVHAIF